MPNGEPINCDLVRSRRHERAESPRSPCDRARRSSASRRMSLVASIGMGAQPVHGSDPDDPVEILRVLPERFHDQFLAEYYQAASEAARQVDGYRQLHDLLRRWRLIAAALSAPGTRSACRRCM
jgi:Family of unknown function (DUF6247)